jgi:nitroimidazol reductase NimA-like FMN-containing flavoprotein (pyridoxamine 5'-phosphate oxidase superfamily)
MDIVEWLRQFKLSTSDSNYNALIVNGKIEEAADEIERLRKRVELLEGYLNGALDFVEGFSHCYTEEARKALGEKE